MVSIVFFRLESMRVNRPPQKRIMPKTNCYCFSYVFLTFFVSKCPSAKIQKITNIVT